MRFEELTRKRIAYQPDALEVLERDIEEAKNAYANLRLLGNQRAAWEVKSNLLKNLKQAKLELLGEMHALDDRLCSVTKAIKLAGNPIDWPRWPSVKEDEDHQGRMDKLMKPHRSGYQSRLTRKKLQAAGYQLE